ncbi:MAG: hypothetical protein HRU78_14940 [Gammaproteobacteria bacterium]|nr:MAG: hypothetical protein HRU78_14940 [Gammaproteobacteria bacterium]
MTLLRIVLLPILFLLAGCEVEIKVKVGNSEKSDFHEKPWQVYATNKKSNKLEIWWSNHDNRDDCLKSVKYDLTSSVHAQWYTKPVGCMYVGSDNKYVLYIMNTLYNSKAFLCVAKLKNRGEADKEFTVAINGAPKETDYYRCVLPE